MADAGIIRNRAKILATMGNARLVEAMAPGELDALMWSFAPSPRPTGERPARFADVPATTAASDALEGAQEARVPLRRIDDDVRAHAVGGHGR
jgi:DNA-3-methyladenine glycosylase I